AAELLTLKGHTSLVTAASFSPDQRLLVTASMDGTAKVWDARTGAELLTLKGHPHGIRWASFSADGSRIVTADDYGTAKIWDSRPFASAQAADENDSARLTWFDSPEGRAYFLRADRPVRHGKLEEVIRTLRAAIRRNPGDAPAHRGLGIALGKQGRL